MSDYNFGEGRERNGKMKRFPLLHGRQIYNMVSMTTLSRNPAEDLVSYITAGADAGDNPVLDPEEAALAAVLEASCVVIDPRTDSRRLMEYCHAPDEETIIKYLPDARGCIELALLPGSKNMDIVWSKGGNVQYTRKHALVSQGGGSVQVYEAEAIADLDDVLRESLSPMWIPSLLDGSGAVIEDAAKQRLYRPQPADKFVAFPNGRGPLYWAQNALHRLEEISETMRRIMSGPNLLPILSGPGVGRRSEVRRVFEDAEYAMVFSGDLKVDRPISTAGIQQLSTEDQIQQARFYSAMKLIEPDAANRPVASDRALRMSAMIKYIQRTQQYLKKVYEALGGTITFDTIITKSADERTKEYDLLLRMKTDGYLEDPEEMQRRVKMLRGV